jgi:hypothetical protein
MLCQLQVKLPLLLPLLQQQGGRTAERRAVSGCTSNAVNH